MTTRPDRPDPAATVDVATGAILLAGGRASRMGGVSKPLLDVGGRALLHRAVDAVAGCRPITIVADVLDPDLGGVGWAREDPPFSGPAAGVAAALSTWPDAGEPTWTFVLACDLTRPDAVVAALRTAASGDQGSAPDGVVLLDEGGHPQWLAGVYRTGALRRAVAATPGGPRDVSMRALLSGLELTGVAAPGAVTRDIDTWEDLETARAHAAPQEET
ncbi:MAG: molybdenum cofactor guanylyltransferase [Microbacteriaceae bacterium]|nr:molybdenum cofactor guanylyltransferase [Microbacteriaceae bacterium]